MGSKNEDVPAEGFYLPDPCQLTFANTLLLSNAAISLGNAFIFFHFIRIHIYKIIDNKIQIRRK